MAVLSQIAPRTQLKIEKIAVLTDFSNNADLALRYAAAFARGRKASLTLAHAYIPPYSAFAAPEAELVYQAFHDLSKDLSARLEEKTKAAYLTDLRCTTLLREGTPKELLAEVSDVDLIVVGTAGYTGVEKAALGSTAEAIFRSSKIPVLTVGPNCHCRGTTEIALKTILYATDFSAGAAIALPYALSIASGHGANLVLLHVSRNENAQFSFERTIASIGPLDRLHKLIADDDAGLIANGIDLNTKLTYLVGFGTPEKVIVEEAKNRKADLIVIGAQGAGALASLLSHFGGGTAYHVAVHAGCPVLTVRSND